MRYCTLSIAFHATQIRRLCKKKKKTELSQRLENIVDLCYLGFFSERLYYLCHDILISDLIIAIHYRLICYNILCDSLKEV